LNAAESEKYEVVSDRTRRASSSLTKEMNNRHKLMILQRRFVEKYQKLMTGESLKAETDDVNIDW
jgi:carbamoylphosphate synthase large subunit